ncbi:MAG: transposase [Planctomycetota bacterium]
MLVPARPPRRKAIRLPQDAYRTPGLAFLVTFNLARGARSLASLPLSRIAQGTFAKATEVVPCDLFTWCVMPDHVHAVLAARAGSSVVTWVQTYKGLVTREARRAGCAIEWQRSFHDRAIRNGDVRGAALYTLLNPVRAGLVERWEDWPLHGSLEWDLSIWE